MTDQNPDRKKLRGALSNVLCNVENYPRPASVHLLGRDMTKLLDKTTDAILASEWLAEHDAAVWDQAAKARRFGIKHNPYRRGEHA